MTYSSQLNTATGEAKTIVDTAFLAAEPNELDLGKYYAFVTPDRGVHTVDLTGDQYKDQPSRKKGTTTVVDSTSFLAYWNKHKDTNSEVYADSERLTVTAVLNANTSDGARWADHRLQLTLRETTAWKQWMKGNGELMEQEEFAEFLEDHLPELLEPDAATMLEIAQSFQAASAVDFQSATRLSSGQRQFQYVETQTTKAGQKGQLTVPETFVIGLIPFEGSQGYRLTVRLRYRISEKGLRLGYKIDRPEETRKTAFGDVLKAITDAIAPTPVMNGAPA